MNDEFSDDFLKDGRIRMDWKLVRWGLSMAFNIDRPAFVGWGFIFLLSAVLPTVFIAMVSQIIDRVQTNVAEGNSINSIVVFLAALVVVMFVNSMFSKLPHLLWYRLEKKYSIGMQQKMCDFMKKVPVRYFDDARTAKVMSLAQKSEKTLGLFISEFFYILLNIINLASLVVLAWTTSYILLFVLIIYLAAVIPVGISNAKKSWETWTSMTDNENAAQYYENLVFKDYFAKETRLLQMKDLIEKKWKHYQKPIIESDIKMGLQQETDWSRIKILSSVVRFVLLFMGLFSLQRGNLTLGGLNIFVSVFERMANTSFNLGYSVMSMYRRSCDLKFKKMMFDLDFSGKRPMPDYEMPKPVKAVQGEPPVVFECNNVSFSYSDDGKDVLKNLSFNIRKGETVALVGENGAGKSTLIKLLLGLYEPREGEMFFEGQNYRELDSGELTEKIGVVFQDFVNFELMVRENVAFGDISKVNDDDVIKGAIKKGDALKVVDKMPKGIDTYMGRWYEKDGVRMSGGEWQRLAMSRAYISNRDILIMDEPAAKLDPIAEMEQFNRIKYSLEDCTSILISHRIGFARLADKIIVLQEGQLMEEGSHEELMKKQGIYYEMFSNQAGWYQKEA